MHAQLLSNSRYTVMLTRAGSGFSHWRDQAITRWREDPTCDDWGSYILLRDVDGGEVWSAGLQPYGAEAGDYAATLSDACAQFVRRDGALVTTLDVAVAPDADAEVRMVTIVNGGTLARTIEVTSYTELVLAPPASDASHPAFSKLFVQTEARGRVLLATRRQRGKNEPEIWAAHFPVFGGRNTGAFEFETDRARFLGRGRVLRNAVAMRGTRLSNTAGTVLDPIFSVRRRVRVAPGASVRVAFVTLAADSRDAALETAKTLSAFEQCEQVFDKAAEHAVAARKQLGIDERQSERFGRFVAPLLYTDAAWRSAPDALERAHGGSPVLWTGGISGDRPIVLVHVTEDRGLDQVRELMTAHRVWRSKGLGVDLVALNSAGDHAQTSLEALAAQQRKRFEEDGDGTPAAMFALRANEVTDALRDGLATAARVVLEANGRPFELPPEMQPEREAAAFHAARASLRAGRGRAALGEPLEFFNGIGGFAQDGREYSITLTGDRCTPMPWINVIANPSFGFIVSAEGGCYTWSVNSQQNPLTPWPNDPVSDTPHEAIYLRDDESGELWSATASPIRVPEAAYSVHHGQGYSRFAHAAHGIGCELLQYVPVDEAVKVSRLRLLNRSKRARRLTITGYVEWALAPNGTVAAPFVMTEIDSVTEALFARNAWRGEFGERIAFVDLCGVQQSFTADRAEFLGCYGSVDHPAALTHPAPLSGRAGAGLDPCGALQTQIELAPGVEAEIVVLLGDAGSREDARKLVEKYRAADLNAVLLEARARWDDVLDAIQVRTPDRALDILLNRWLLYQALGCRVWARSGYYQSSGAYGFRDQLQDVMALCVAKPEIAREHLLRAASRQFVEGDVQHWWLPPAGQGVRTTMTDDRVWLPFVATHYIGITGDHALLDEAVPFIEGEKLKDDQHEAFFTPSVAGEQASLYEHCARAIDVSLSLGEHDLPLIGTGDWNDGMNRVGEEGRGESVWLAWFLIATIDAFIICAQARNDKERATRWQKFVADLRGTLESAAGWDGKWYRRGYYDDGTPLGSSKSSECKIDTIAQSWSVIAGAADAKHAAQAMAAVDKHLIREDDKLALLFTPPFDRNSKMNPGYIKAYPPGIRENGGQYTHGAIWSVYAYAMLGDGDRAGSLLALLNPVHHSSTPRAVERYKVEPYVSCADVYSVAPHVGRGGWTWYTGSGGWFYRAGLEAILGFRLQADMLSIDPCIPQSWPGYQIIFRRRGASGTVSSYQISVENPRHVCRGVVRVELDGSRFEDNLSIPLVDDGRMHRVRIVLG